MLNKLEQFLFYFLFFAIPLQTRKILYSPGWYFNEWQSISIYATDLILLVLFGLWAYQYLQARKFSIFNFQFSIKSQFSIFKKLPKHDLFLLGFLAAAAISVKNSSNFYVGVFLWLKLAEFALFYFYLKTYAIKRFNFIGVLYALILGGVFQAVVAIGQFLKQGDLGLRLFGESVLNPHMTGVASFFTLSRVEGFIDSGEKVIRAYGTTPHPNVLAAYLFLAIFAFYFLILRRNKPHHLHSHIMIYGSVEYVLLLFGLFFTFSRTIIFLWGVGFLAIIVMSIWAGSKTKTPVDNRLAKSIIHRGVALVLATFIVVGAFSLLYWPEVQSRMTLSSEEEAVRLRVFYNKESLEGGINLFGIGLGDFTGWLMEQNPNLPSHVYQPVHNIYLLIYSETGLAGITMFLLFLFFLLKNSYSKKTIGYWLLAIGFLFIGLFDHFLFTIQQGRFVFWLGLTLLAIGDIIGEQSSSYA